jgi:proteasome beta subunit
MGTKTRRWRRAAFAGHFATRHKGSVKENAQGRSQPIQALSAAHGPVMDHSQLGLDQDFSGAVGDFPSLLRRKGLLGPAVAGPVPQNAIQQRTWQPTEATTILAFKFSGGVLVAGDRRATAGNTVVYDRADKVLEIDRHSIMAIAGVPATAWEMARVLEHSLQYFRRTQLQEMSVDGKVRALSKLLRDNFGFVMQGVGVVVPIFATYDPDSKPEARLYFYDAMGAQFEATDYAATGSGSPAVRGILYYENNWGAEPLLKLKEEEAISLALRALDTAAESDTATAGVDRSGKIYPVIKIVSQEGITTFPESKIAAVFKEMVA